MQNERMVCGESQVASGEGRGEDWSSGNFVK